MRKLILATALVACGQAQALSYTIWNNLALWQADVGSSSLEDFSSYAQGSSVQGATILPGLTVSTNLGQLRVHDSDLDLFATGAGTGSRAAGNAYYEFDLGGNYRAISFDISSFESEMAPFNVPGGAVGPGLVEITFVGGLTIGWQIWGGNADDVFGFNLSADTPIERVRWYEALEAGGINEETTLDNVRAALPVNPVPEPSALLLAAGALGLLARRRRG